ncbi:5'-nucleotidase [Bathymodiolus platifrons methanotrophic gill symbiont]|uniref:5'/3'-nucleotidase SurE n=1 Tax=Bathymodiolus platifrons methanotrophic gill symbiont TaxID=113268 RepID=UPI000B40E844|nr:5'/3'-nucleotidase SurE [Bathymodiolus platifrons methanotrophic gill symbiont]MCK5870483.1 5'/3'-nucleotidase SurE [Methyloprofundus sp.]TXK96510.1 5'/3'-nucleotidase SurE [Methylococcaceae bacterium CS5]TXK99428.1 5'/3'-nucleotidase SurE [Methylococcaceae bacterium CS4]TXL03560.1 5'/3'-nucleotidase SurE [Methylococcaceae bacterium CS3]TXL05367.1 5'/3'-nucleotidase SurE [Methylococcaceae bacterium CS1]TXL10119.1 5'/3'-nucleotidase SurE [Methylococcaceae bacterium CS2]TXL13888.1 5'/3'-nuc
MHILLSNDDGYLAQGLVALADGLRLVADISVVAPDKNRSAASNSLTLEMPLRAQQMDNGFIKVDGTPTDCVHLAITGLLETEPDMVFAGINHGANLGDDVLYSGTVAAATEGRFLGLPAIAISMVSSDPQYFDTAVKVAGIILQRLLEQPLAKDILLNINVPDLPWSEINGFQSTRLGQRHKAEPVIETQDPRGRTIYWVGPPGAEQDAGPGTDFYAVSQGYVSVTPLQLDLTRYDMLDKVKEWLPR